ncbi:MAG: hypothetical protein IT482_02085 [Gammaproteobacteria bacterium]|jgi:hypothetical protein|nr:hypothetical protein [Gammaproteobacteria bacterium]
MIAQPAADMPSHKVPQQGPLYYDVRVAFIQSGILAVMNAMAIPGNRTKHEELRR